MRRSVWRWRLAKAVMAAAGGSTVFGGSCASDVREQIVAGALDFVNATTADTLSALFPLPETIDSLFTPSGGQ